METNISDYILPYKLTELINKNFPDTPASIIRQCWSISKISENPILSNKKSIYPDNGEYPVMDILTTVNWLQSNYGIFISVIPNFTTYPTDVLHFYTYEFKIYNKFGNEFDEEYFHTYLTITDCYVHAIEFAVNYILKRNFTGSPEFSENN